jgi:hypothetical protein
VAPAAAFTRGVSPLRKPDPSTALDDRFAHRASLASPPGAANVREDPLPPRSLPPGYVGKADALPLWRMAPTRSRPCQIPRFEASPTRDTRRRRRSVSRFSFSAYGTTITAMGVRLPPATSAVQEKPDEDREQEARTGERLLGRGMKYRMPSGRAPRPSNVREAWRWHTQPPVPFRRRVGRLPARPWRAPLAPVPSPR